LTKRTQLLDASEDMAKWLAAKAYLDSPLPGRMQNEPMPDLDRVRQEVA